jgi:regulator of sirC expression with transglutaminase-like and TPR domain
VANFQKQQYSQAQRGLADSLERNPNDANAHYNLGRVLWAQGGAKNAEQVLEAFGVAIRLDPTMAAPWRDAGLVFYELRDVNRAAKAFERYLQLAPDAPEAPKIKAFLNSIQVPLQ